MEPLEAAVREKVRLENVWKKYQKRGAFFGIWLILVAGLLIVDRYSTFHPFRNISIGWVTVTDILLLAGFVSFVFDIFPSRGERETWAQLFVLGYRILADVKEFAEELDSLRSVGYAWLFDNPTFRYWVPLYREFQRLGIDVPPPVEERFASLDRNRLNFFWAPVRRERQRKALKSVE